jgi:hypothetical protein
LGLTDNQIDPKAGVVRGIVSLKGNPLHQDIKAWIVIAGMTTYNPAPNSHTLYHKMLIVVDARTGHAVFLIRQSQHHGATAKSEASVLPRRLGTIRKDIITL